MDIQQYFGKSLEAYEVAKLIKKYTELGYEIIYNRRKRHPFFVRPDLHLINKETGDEIIFEVKSKYTYKKETFNGIIEQKEFYKSKFPHARFVLVLAKEEEPISFESKTIKKQLLDYIKSNYHDALNDIYKINKIEFEEVDYFECVNVDFGDFTSIKIQGYANIKYWIEVDEDDFKGKKLADGTPFYFDLKMNYDPSSNVIFKIDNSLSKIKFDFT
jgi:hypothetical protein